MHEYSFSLISPRDGFAGLVSNDQVLVKPISEPHCERTSLTVLECENLFPDLFAYQSTNQTEIAAEMNRASENAQALDFFLLLFDADLTDSTKAKIAVELELLLGVSSRQNYVLDIVLARPLPKEFNTTITSAKTACLGHETSLATVELFIECKERSVFAWDAWREIESSPLVDHTGPNAVLGALVHFGVFRDLVQNCETKYQVDHMKANLLFNVGLRERVDSRILSAFIAAYSKHLPQGEPSKKRELHTPSEQSSENENARSSKPWLRSNADKAQRQAKTQIENIAKLFGHGQDAQAGKLLNELISSQTLKVQDHRYAVMSLTNISSQSRGWGRRDISMQCLNQALTLENGIDSKLYFEIARELRSHNEPVRALTCLETAIEIDDGTWSEAINLEIIRCAVDQGLYSKALDSYLALPNISIEPAALCSLGTLYRKMGNYDTAFATFRDVLAIDKTHLNATAGWAETNKNKGRYRKAIDRYELILKGSETEISPDSSKVYQLALSYLYRLTGSADRSIAILLDLSQRFPKDSQVHLQLAKAYVATNERNLADRYFRLAQGPNLSQLAAKLYLTAIDDPSMTSSPNPPVTLGIAPEDVGVDVCSSALLLIGKRDFQEAIGIVDSVTIVDHLQADFSAVLKYHALSATGQKIEKMQHQRVNRLRKGRGYKRLQEVVDSLDRHDFGEALSLERKVCLQLN